MAEEINLEHSDLAWFFGGTGTPRFAENLKGEKRGLSGLMHDFVDGPLKMLQQNSQGAPTMMEFLLYFRDWLTDLGLDRGDIIRDSYGDFQVEMRSIISIISDYPDTLPEVASLFPIQAWDNVFRAHMAQVLGTSVWDQPSDRAPDKSNTGLSAVQIFPIDLAFTSRNTDDLDIWFNAIPNIEFSRCIPYFDLNVISSNKPVGADGRPAGLSQHLFLSSNAKLSDSDRILAEAVGAANILDEGDGTTNTLAGMELFTSPQTLVNTGDDFFELGEGTGTSILDKFRPFMTLKNFSVNIQPSFGMSCFKTAKLTLTLHDRSRLSQISSLVRPDVYGTSELLIEYGWSHPDAINSPGTNPIGDFLNRQRVSEKYRIMNSSFNFSDDGQVDINLDLSMKGSTELWTETTTNGEGWGDAMKTFSNLTDALSDAFKEIKGTGAVLEDVVGKTILKAGSSSAALKMSDEDLKKIREWTSSRTKASSEDTTYIGKVASILQQLYGENIDNKEGKLQELEANAKNAYDRKITILRTGIDPFKAAFPLPTVTESGNAAGLTGNDFSKFYGLGYERVDYISLGKLLLVFLGKPLKSSGNFDDIQFIFYPFNQSAGHIRHHNISQFPINITKFNSLYEKKFGPTYDTSLASFISFINKEFIQNEMNSEVYGLSELYTPEKEDGKPTGKVVLKSKYAKDPKILSSTKAENLKDAYPAGHAISFIKPQLEAVFECSPGLKLFGVDGPVRDEYQSILRVYVHDKAATANAANTEILSSMSKANFQEFPSDIETVPTPTITDIARFGSNCIPAGHGKRKAQAFLALGEEGANLLSKATSVTINGKTWEGESLKTEVGGYVTINATADQLKKHLKTVAPSCTIGSTGNPVLNANLSSMNDAALASIRLSSATQEGKGTISGNANDGMPTFVQPVSLTTEMLGMPLLAYGTEIFFDFNTGTNIDNFYLLTGISHSIDQGNFKTNATWTYVDGFEKFRSANSSVQRQMVLAALLAESSEGGTDGAEERLKELLDSGETISIDVSSEATSQD